jgi:hypothetical protein
MEYVQAGEASCTMDMAHPHSPAVSLAPAYREPCVHTPPVTPPNASPDLDAEVEDAPLRFRRVDDVLGPTPGPRLADRQLTGELLAAISNDPSSVDVSLRHRQWKQVVVEELESTEENRTWSLVDLPKGQRLIGVKWVFKLKQDENGEVVKHKARLVAKGYVQRQGIDFEEVFAPVARMESVSVILCLAAHFNWIVHHMDVKTAFLNGELLEEVYVSQPPGFIKEDQKDKDMKLHKALYGLRQTPQAWNSKLDAELHKLGFSRCKTEYGLYTRVKDQQRLIVGVHVDDLIILEKSITEVSSFKTEMMEIFRMGDLGPLSYYLGIEVKQSP